MSLSLVTCGNIFDREHDVDVRFQSCAAPISNGCLGPIVGRATLDGYVLPTNAFGRPSTYKGIAHDLVWHGAEG